MNIEEFDNTRCQCGMSAKYNCLIYGIGSCDFDERLVGLVCETLGSDDLTWVRCENIELIED